MDGSLVVLAVGAILAISVVVALVAVNVNVPFLVVFLLFGMLLGRDGLHLLNLSSIDVAQMVGTIGLIAILFEGGISTSRRRLRAAFGPAILLSTVGVFVTAIFTGIAAHYLLPLSWSESMLLAAVVSSTDAAAVFATLRTTPIRRGIARILEAESGLNDPMAIALTIGFISWIKQPSYNVFDFSLLLGEQLVIGLVAGLVLGVVATRVFAHLPRSIGAFAPVASVATAFLAFGITDALGGSGFLAVYLVGLAIGSTPSRYRSSLTTFHEGIAFVAQVSMFIIMGLFVVPHRMTAIIVPGIILAVLLVVIIRPFAVWIAVPRRMLGRRAKFVVGWAGLRGAVPIVLGTYVLSAHIAHGQLIFNTVFFIVLASTALQGTTLNWVAKKLGVIEKIPNESERPLPDSIEELHFRVRVYHAIAGVHIYEVGLPKPARITGIERRGKKLKIDEQTIIRARDHLIIKTPYSMLPEVEDVFMRWRRRV